MPERVIDLASEQLASRYEKGIRSYLSGQKLHDDGISIPDPEWVDLANQFKGYKNKILGLGEAVVVAEFERDSWTHPIPDSEKYRTFFFSNVAFKFSGYLLADILKHRLDQTKTMVGHLIKPAAEAQAIWNELGKGEDREHDILGCSFTFPYAGNTEYVIKKVLEGNLRLEPQTPFDRKLLRDERRMLRRR